MVGLGEQELAAGRAEQALKAGQRAIVLNNMREDAHRLIVQALAATGRNAEALKHYQGLVALLRRELNTEPDAETRSLIAGLRNKPSPSGSPAVRETAKTFPPLVTEPPLASDPEQEVDAERPGTIYNALFYHSPAGELALHHRKLVPTNHERLVWGQGDGRGLSAVETGFGRLGGLICWENYMPLARVALYESGVEIYVASTADDGDAWQATLVHIARESRAYVVAPAHFQREDAYPDDFPLAAEIEGAGTIGRGGSAILAPDGSYLAGPLYDEEGILYAELDPTRLLAERQRFDPVGHYSRPDVLQLTVRADGATTSTRPSAQSSRP